MSSPVDWAGAVVAAGAVAGELYADQRRRRVLPMALAVLGLGFAGGGIVSAAFALAVLAVRVHPLLAFVPGVLAGLLGEPLALAVTAAWILGGGGPWWASVPALAAGAWLSWPLSALALAGGVVGRLFASHPANAALARAFARAAPWGLPVPAFVLLGLASVGHAGGFPHTIFLMAALAALLGLLVAAALAGLSLRFLALDGRPGAYIAASLAAVLGVLQAAVAGTLSQAAPSAGLIIVPLVLASAPFVSVFVLRRPGAGPRPASASP